MPESCGPTTSRAAADAPSGVGCKCCHLPTGLYTSYMELTLLKLPAATCTVILVAPGDLVALFCILQTFNYVLSTGPSKNCLLGKESKQVMRHLSDNAHSRYRCPTIVAQPRPGALIDSLPCAILKRGVEKVPEVCAFFPPSEC